MTIVTWLFWGSLATLIYTYAGYPLLAAAGAGLLRRRVHKAPYEPFVTVMIAAHNEAAHIRDTIENKLAQGYPRGKLQIVVVSDGSTDGTDDIARESADDSVVVIRQEPRRGKTAALNRGMREATGDIVVFADANSVYAPGAIRALVANFADPRVGYVTGRMVYEDRGTTAVGLGCRAYMAYEHRLRCAETALGSIVGVNGGIDAIRRDLYVQMSDDALPDFVLPLDVVERGFRVVYEPQAVLREDALTNASSEYRMRVRVALRAWWTLKEMRGLFNVRRYGVFAVQLFSHKALRYCMFVAAPACYLSALVLALADPFYRVAAIGGTGALVLALAGYVLERRGRSVWPCTMPYYFLLVNLAAGQALYEFLRGRRRTVWTPRLG